jgi:hypothetical protein
MGTTEESIVYQLISAIRAGELNSDEVVGERRIRSFLRTHRAQILAAKSKNGLIIQGECFQKVPISLTRTTNTEWEADLPGIIYLKNYYGTKLLTPGFSNISISNEEDYHLHKKNIIGGSIPMAKIEDNTLTLRIPENASIYAMNDALGLKAMLQCLKNKERVIMSAILVDPEDGIDYDWTTDPYPMPAEEIQLLKNQVLRQEFNLILQTKSDQIPNTKNDTLRYHDQGKVQS